MNTITLAKLLRALINGNDYPVGTNIIINRKELIYCDNISWYNNLLYMHKETGSYLYVQHTDDENDVRINIILPNETLKDSYCKHHLADDFADNPYCWDKLDNDYESSEFTVEYKKFNYIFRLETFNTNKHLLYRKAQCLFVFFNIF